MRILITISVAIFSTRSQKSITMTTMLRALLQGQLISMLITGTGIFASLLSADNANIPLVLTFFNYALLSLFIWRKSIVQMVYINSTTSSQIATRKQDHRMIDSQKEEENGSNENNDNNNEYEISININEMKFIDRIFYKITKNKIIAIYLAAAIIDVEANFLIIQAYNYTSITSIMLLDCFTIPCAMILSYTFLGCKYSTKHFIGVCLCLLGLGCIIISDSLNIKSQYGSNPLFGDMLCLTGSGNYYLKAL